MTEIPSPQPAPNDWRLPADLKSGHVTFRKGVHCSALVSRMDMLHREAFGADRLTPEQKAKNLAALQVAQPMLARAKAEWHEDDGAALWWAWNGHGWAGEAAWIGTPLDDNWPGYHTHWTVHPDQPAIESPATSLPAAVNRYCRAGMCVATDAKHEADCKAARP